MDEEEALPPKVGIFGGIGSPTKELLPLIRKAGFDIVAIWAEVSFAMHFIFAIIYQFGLGFYLVFFLESRGSRQSGPRIWSCIFQFQYGRCLIAQGRRVTNNLKCSGYTFSNCSQSIGLVFSNSLNVHVMYVEL